jgi:hypothetical protein
MYEGVGLEGADECLQELSLTVPITNSLAFLFTVLGEWWAEGKVISRGESADHGFAGWWSIRYSTVTDSSRYMDRHELRARRDKFMCGVQVIMILPSEHEWT